MNDITTMSDRFPLVDPMQFPDITTLAETYQELRENAIQLERLAIRVARLS